MTMRRHLPNLHDLLAFDAAARTLNFTRAASELNVQQPAVSRRIAQLEAWLGTSLFLRKGSQLSLSVAGERLFAAVKRGLDDIEAAALECRSASAARLISIDVSIAFGSCWLVPRLTRLKLAEPEIEVQLVSRYRNTPLQIGGGDIVVYFRDEQQTYPGQRQVFGEELVAIASPRYLEQAEPAVTSSTLLQHPLLVLDEPHHRDDWRGVLAPLSLPAPAYQPGLAFGNFVVYLHAVMNGRGIGLAWKQLVSLYLASGALVEVPGIASCSDRGYFAFPTEGAETNPQVRRVMDWLIAEGSGRQPMD